MNKYIYQEFKRLIIKKNFLIINITLITIIFGLVNVLTTKTYEQQIENLQTSIRYSKRDKDIAKTIEEKDKIKQQIDDSQQQINDLKIEINTINNYNKDKINEQIAQLKKQITPENKNTINDEIDKLNYYRDHNMAKKNMRPQGIYETLEILIVFFPILFLAILILLLSDIVAGEYSPNTIKLLVTRTISRKKIIISKFIASIILSVNIIVTSTLIFIIESGIHLGISDYKLPFKIGENYIWDKSLNLTNINSQMKYIDGSGKYISILSTLIISVLILIVISISIISIIIFISTVSRNSLISAFLNIIIIMGIGIFIFIKGQLGGYIQGDNYGIIGKFLPTTYILDIVDTLNGQISVKFNSNISIFFAFTVCFIWVLITMYLSICIFRKKDFD